VDDGSSDGTGALADEAAASHEWITVVHRANRGFRKTGGGVVEAFQAGYAVLGGQHWDFIAKLDADLSFERNYFEEIIKRFEADPKLGLAGGVIWERRGSRLVVGSPADPPFHVRGATKIYRRQCWRDIGGLVQDLGWDTVDEVKANMLGWRTGTFEGLRVVHHKPTGSADGPWSHLLNQGRCNYVTGYHPLFMACKCIKNLPRKPYILASLGMAIGFISGYLQHAPRVRDTELVLWLRRQQLRRLTLRRSIYGL
jgi:glycosyltransferase involved in cell wall biosynthesis